ncbi:Ptchd3, partial [Symbiodinium pilosum]
MAERPQPVVGEASPAADTAGAERPTPDPHAARAKVPPLHLSTLPPSEDQGSLMNTDSVSSSYRRATSESDGTESGPQRLNSKGSAVSHPKRLGAEPDPPVDTPPSLGDLVAALQRDVSFDDADSFAPVPGSLAEPHQK